MLYHQIIPFITENFCASNGLRKNRKDSSNSGMKHLQIIYLIRTYYPGYVKSHMKQQQKDE
jgi:hypothetical protein